MRMIWAGTTWTVDDHETPDYINRGMTSPGSFRRSYHGTGRRHTRYDKWSFPLSWSVVGTNVRDKVSNMVAQDGTVTLEYSAGTFTTYALPGSYQEAEAGYEVFNIGVTLEEA